MWIDADAVFQRRDIPLEWFWDGVSSAIWTGTHTNGVNTGVFFIRHCEESFQFLDRWEAMGEDKTYRHHCWWENLAAMHLQDRKELPGLMLPTQPANAYPHRSKEGFWSADDLVAHPCGVKHAVRHAMLADLAFRASLGDT